MGRGGPLVSLAEGRETASLREKGKEIIKSLKLLFPEPRTPNPERLPSLTSPASA